MTISEKRKEQTLFELRCVELWNQGLDVQQIAKRSNRKRDSVHSALSKMGVKRSIRFPRINSSGATEQGLSVHTAPHWIEHR